MISEHSYQVLAFESAAHLHWESESVLVVCEWAQRQECERAQGQEWAQRQGERQKVGGGET